MPHNDIEANMNLFANEKCHAVPLSIIKLSTCHKKKGVRPCLVVHIYKYKTRFCICKWPMSMPSRYESDSHICTTRKFTKSKLQNV